MQDQTRLGEAEATKAELLQKIEMISDKSASLCDVDSVHRSTAEKFVAESTWWLRHPSGNGVRAQRYKLRLEGCDAESWDDWDGDWKVKFSVHTFHVGEAIVGCVEALDYWLDERRYEGVITPDNLRQLWVRLEGKIRGSISHRSGHRYKWYRGKDERFPDDMIFGAMSIDVRDFRLCFLQEAGVLNCFDMEQLEEAGILKRAD